MIERFTKLCETLGEYLCSYCVYQGRLGHCRYYNGSYTLNGDDGMTVNKRYFKEDFYNEYAIKKEDIIIAVVDSGSNARRICNELNALYEENEQLKQFIDDLTTKGTGRIDLANGYSYRVSAVLTNWKGDVND